MKESEVDEVLEYIEIMERLREQRIVPDPLDEAILRLLSESTRDPLTQVRIQTDRTSVKTEPGGLGVDGVELYRAASGESVALAVAEDPRPSGLLFKAIDKIIHDSDFEIVVKTLLKNPAKIKAVKKVLAIK